MHACMQAASVSFIRALSLLLYSSASLFLLAHSTVGRSPSVGVWLAGLWHGFWHYECGYCPLATCPRVPQGTISFSFLPFQSIFYGCCSGCGVCCACAGKWCWCCPVPADRQGTCWASHFVKLSADHRKCDLLPCLGCAG